MNKKEIVTNVLHQIFEYHFLGMTKAEFLKQSFDDSEDFDSDNLYGVYEDVNDTFDVSEEEFGEAEDGKELVSIITENWSGDKLEGVNKQLKWVPMSERSMDEWEEENPDWEDWKP